MRGGACAAVALGIGLVLALHTGVSKANALPAVPAVLLTAGLTLALFGVCGYAPARLLARGELEAHRGLLVLPLGAVTSALALAVLGLLHVPLKVALAVLITTAVLAAVLERRWVLRAPTGPREGARRSPGSSGSEAPFDQPAGDRAPWPIRVGLPLLLATVVALISLLPIFRAGFATVPGQNGDAILVVGTAVLLEHAPPTATREDLPIPHIPLEWRSKYPIYYPLAAVSALGGQDPIAAFPTVAAVMLALGALGFFLFARYVLRAQVWAGLLAAGAVPLDRIVMYVTVHPYYNELWGQFALPFMLLSGWRYLHAPDRRSGILFALFAALGLLAYPLMFPFPVLFLVTLSVLIRRRRIAAGQPLGWVAALRLPRLRARPWVWVPVAVVGVPVALVLLRGFLEKTLSALAVLAPWTSLAYWHGSALGYLPWPQFFGMPGPAGINFAGMAIVCALAAFGLYRLPADVRLPLGVMVAITVLIAVYFRLRTYGELFFFKDLAFLGPYVVLLALLALAGIAASAVRWRSWLGIGGIAGALVVLPAAAVAEIDLTTPHADRSVLELRAWNRALPRSASVRIDIPPSGYQLWVTYMFTDHPLVALYPLGGIFPHPFAWRKAAYVIAMRAQPRPLDAIGSPVLQNADYELWRMNPRVPGPPASRRSLIYDTNRIAIG